MIDVTKQLFLQVVSSSAKLSIIVILLLMLTKPIEKRYSAGFRYYSWLAVLVVFLIPFQSIGLSYRIDVPRFSQEKTQEIFEQIVCTDDEGSHKTVGKPSFDIDSEDNGIRKPDIVFLASLIWIFGAALYFALHVKRYYFFKKAVKRFSLPTHDIRIGTVLTEEQLRIGSRRSLPVRVCPIADTPLLTGLLYPILILPNNDYNDDELHFIFRHELIHHKRKDIWYQFLTLIFMSLHWFNPLAYVMARAIEIDGETSCDEAVLKNCPYEARILYGEMLISFLKAEKMKKSYLTTTFFGGKKAMAKRLKLIASKKMRKNGIAAMALLIIVAIIMSLTAAAGTVEFIDSKDMVKNSSKRENTIIMDTDKGYDVFIGCEPIRESDESIKIPLKSFIVFIDYKVTFEDVGKTIAVSNGNRTIELTAASKTATVDGNVISLTKEVISENNGFYVYVEDVEALFSYKVSYDSEKNNVVLRATDKTPEAVKDITPPSPLHDGYVAPKTVTVLSGDKVLTISIDNKAVVFPDAQPFIDESGRTQVPVRALAEMLNCQVIWNEKTQGVTIIDAEGAVVSIKIGESTMYADGKIVEMDTSAKIINNRTYIPLRFVSEALGFNVFWKY